MLLCGEDSSHHNGYSVISEKALQKAFLLLGFELADVDRIDVRDFNLVRPDLDALNVLKLSECPPLSHILLHASNMLNE